MVLVCAKASCLENFRPFYETCLRFAGAWPIVEQDSGPRNELSHTREIRQLEQNGGVTGLSSAFSDASKIKELKSRGCRGRRQFKSLKNRKLPTFNRKLLPAV